ncbi:hypothetical protein ACFX4Y_23705 [Priestia sp. YIM B13446]|uniref:FAD synthetase family protein n=1 Tax=Priestia TaxID=2800373 RepID=UPI000BFB53C4|nr:FAD synthetase family protein [Priestia megaterium]PGN62180.1 hypothetical protein CN978_24940 [Priestia megaterium]
MEVIYLSNIDQMKRTFSPHAMTLGFFDGIHLGHQLLIEEAKNIARHKKIEATLMTFHPHPNEIISNEKARKYLTPLPIKLKKLNCMGLDKVFIIDFTKQFASLSPRNFIERYILGINAIDIVVGFDFTFGYRAQGNVDSLKKSNYSSFFKTTVISRKDFESEKVSSTLIKKIIADEGDVELIPSYLGSYYEIEGMLYISYDLNNNNVFLDINEKYIMPKPGVYEVEIIINKKEYVSSITIRNELQRLFKVNLIQDISLMEPAVLTTVRFLKKKSNNVKLFSKALM